jgi:ssDNA-binding Zn-finger/Zn-ribbon topoisomerase 1
MVLRVNRQTQEQFWGCSTFPDCRGTRNLDGSETNWSKRKPRRQPLDSDLHDHMPNDEYPDYEVPDGW